jgi:hypothetical protein
MAVRWIGGDPLKLRMFRPERNNPSRKMKLSPTCAAPVTVMVLRVVDPAQAVTGADVEWPRWRLPQHHRDRLLLLGLRSNRDVRSRE